MRWPTNVSHYHGDEKKCSNDGRLNTQIEKFDRNNGAEPERGRKSKTIFEAAELQVHIWQDASE